MGASEDAAYLINAVQETGGTATYVGIGSDIPSGHHTSRFGFDEDSLEIAVDVVTAAIEDVGLAGETGREV